MRREDYLSRDYTDEDRILIKIFQEEVRKLDLLYFSAITRNSWEEAKKVSEKLNEITKLLQYNYNERADYIIPKEYLKGATYISDYYYKTDTIGVVLNAGKDYIYKVIQQLGPVHLDAVNALLNTSKNYVKSSLDGMERQAITMLGELQGLNVREELARGMIQGDSLEKMKQSVKDYFQRNRISGFKDRSGKLWTMDRYVDMLVRTETAIANIQGTINRAIQLGLTKFKIVEQSSCCSYCAEYNGDIVDISQGVVDLPPFHPNCRGYIVVVSEVKNPTTQTTTQTQSNPTQNNNIQNDIENVEPVKKKRTKKENPILENEVLDENDIQNKEAKTVEEKIKKALDIVESSSKYLTYEQEALIDIKTGEVVRMAAGGKNGVYLFRGETVVKEPFIMTHNHPNSSTFSEKDFSNWISYKNQYGMRASSKVGTYYLYAENQGDRALFRARYNYKEKEALARARADNKGVLKDYYKTTDRDEVIVLADGTKYTMKKNPLEFDKFRDEHYRKYLRETLQETADTLPGVKFEFIPNDGKVKNTKLNTMYINKVKELKKIKGGKYKKYTTKENIEINKYL